MAKRKTKKAKSGMWLTNGEIYCKKVTPGRWNSVDNYYEITDEEYNEIFEKQNEVNENDV